MKLFFKLLFVLFLLFTLGYFVLGYVSSYVGWYGYEKWKHRIATSNIAESKERGVFVKELHFRFDSFPEGIKNFRPYIEKGFKYGLKSSKETMPLLNSNYPYQLSFNFIPSEATGILLKDDQLKKFDSSNATNGYLKYPELNDTIIVTIVSEKIHTGTIKIWQ